MMKYSRVHAALIASSMSVIGMVGCSDVDADLADDDGVDVAAQQTEPVSSRTPNPNALYITKVSAQGSGCTPGTWRESVSSDGEVFTLTFSGYDIKINPSTTSTVTKNCIINVEFNSPNGISYSVTKLQYSGYSFLEQGVTAEQSAYYNFSGVGVTSIDGSIVPAATRAIKGPYDKDFVFVDDVNTNDLVWSECGVKRTLNVRTRLTLTNSRPARSGYINVLAVDGATKTDARLELHLQKRACTPAK